jgi:hypothetical protein
MWHRAALLILCTTLSIASMATEITLGDSTFVGGRVQVDEAVDGPLTAAAGRISVNAPVSGSARLAAGRIHINAAVTGDVQAAAGRVTIDAPIGGDVKVAAGALKLGPNARIAGSLHFRGGHFERDPGAQVAGTIDHSTAHTRSVTPFSGSTARWIWTATLVLLAALAAGAMPAASTRMTQELRARPWMAPLLGFIAITCIPVAAVLVMITIIGIPIGILALFAYAALLLVGYVCVSVVVSGLLLERVKVESAALWAWRAGAAALVMLLLALLTRIPFVGGVILFAALVFGVGLIVAAVFRKGEAPPVVAA